MFDGQTVSVVDDDASVRSALSRLLRSFGISAKAFESAEEFLQSSAIENSACLIVDVQMPGIGGLELQRRLLALGRSLPIVFITAFPSEIAKSEALHGGAVGFLDKPFASGAIEECLKAAFNLSQDPSKQD